MENTYICSVRVCEWACNPSLNDLPEEKGGESMRNGDVPGTIFMTSDSGWITQEMYLEWFTFFYSIYIYLLLDWCYSSTTGMVLILLWM